MEENSTYLTKKNDKKYCCKICDFNTSKKTDYTRHLETDKHKKTQKDSEFTTKNEKFYVCKCGKIYKYDSGYYRHKKKCTDDSKLNELGLTDNELISILIKQNDKLMKQNEKLMNIVESGTNNTNNTNANIQNNNNHTNSHNKTFNLQFFLNETCKDAMNMSDFVSSIKPKLIDLENTGRLGYVEGISKIILTNLNNLEQHFRPIHCSDSKREVIYIKDNNEWTKESDTKPILTKAIKVIANENIKNISEWRKEYPDCTYADSKKNNLYLKIVSNSMCGSSKDETDRNINKIITNIAKEVTIDKY